jgi:hypothetical protein
VQPQALKGCKPWVSGVSSAMAMAVVSC